MSDKYILDGRKVVAANLIEWATWFEKNNEKRKVAYDEVNGWRVSTVFLGIDHRFGDGPPLLFETYVFPGNEWSEEWGERCSTYDEAEEQHRRGLEFARTHTPDAPRQA